VSGVAERLTFLNLLVNEDVLWLSVVELSLLLLLLIERSHSKLLVGQSLVLTAGRTISIMSVVSKWRIFAIGISRVELVFLVFGSSGSKSSD
jgi:hypothetical protein